MSFLEATESKRYCTSFLLSFWMFFCYLLCISISGIILWAYVFAHE